MERYSKRSSAAKIVHLWPSFFPKFNKLPKELRVMIWHAAIPDPRIVYLKQDYMPVYYCTRVWSDKALDDTFDHDDKIPTFFDFHDRKHVSWGVFRPGPGLKCGPKYNSIGLRSLCPPPNLLFVCRESFEVATKHYTKAFGTCNASPSTWFDFERDTLYLDWDIIAEEELVPRDFLISEASRVRHLATFDFPQRSHWSNFMRGVDYPDYESWLCEIFSVFTNLTQLTVVLEQCHNISMKKNDGKEIVIKTLRNDLTPFSGSPRWDFDRSGLEQSIYEYYQSIISRIPELDMQKLKSYLAQLDPPMLNKLPTFDFQVFASPKEKVTLEYREGLHVEEERSGGRLRSLRTSRDMRR
jgi:hypothetical protein